MTTRVSSAHVHDVACKYCGAGVDEACRLKEGDPANHVHRQRRAAFDAHLVELAKWDELEGAAK